MLALAARRGAPPRVYFLRAAFLTADRKKEKAINNKDEKEAAKVVRINGKEEHAAGITLKEYLERKNYPADGIAVECNEEIVEKIRYEDYVLKDGDVVEIVSFVGGG